MLVKNWFEFLTKILFDFRTTVLKEECLSLFSPSINFSQKVNNNRPLWRQGFTLLEIVLALLILSIIATGLASTFYSSLAGIPISEDIRISNILAQLVMETQLNKKFESIVSETNITFEDPYSNFTYDIEVVDELVGIPETNDLKSVRVKVKNIDNPNILAELFNYIRHPDTTPPVGSILINNDAPITNTVDVTLNLSATDESGITGYRVANGEDASNGTIYNVSKTNSFNYNKPWTLPVGDGEKKVSVQYRDAANNWCENFTDTIILETIGFTGSIMISNDADYTNDRDVTLKLQASHPLGITGYRVADGIDASGGTITTVPNTLNFSEDIPWTLPGGDGYKWVAVQYRDSYNNWSDNYLDSIFLDTTNPTGSIIINSGNPTYTNTTSVTLYLTYDDIDGSGVDQVRYSNDGLSWTSWEAPAATRAWTLLAGDGLKTVYYQIRDYAGYVAQFTDTITLDTFPPTFTIQYFSDINLTNSLGDNPRLIAGTYYLRITSNEALSGTPSITIDAEGTANDVTNATTTLVLGNIYRYTRTITSDVAAIGVVLENISLTGTDLATNTSTNVDPTNEESKAAYTDTTPPTVTNVTSSTANGIYTTGATISIQVVFSEIVFVTGTPQLTLATGGTSFPVNYSSGSGTNTLTFTYTVAAGHTTADLDYVATTSLALNGGTIRDVATNNATLTLPAPGATGSLGFNKNIVIDTTPPTVTNVTSSTADGIYTTGATISIQVVFSEIVFVTGTPQLTLATGGTSFPVNYSSGSGTNTLTFTYTVAAGHTTADLDYVATTSLALNGGTIRDVATNNATLTLPAPGAAGSLGANKDILIALTPNGSGSVTGLTRIGANTNWEACTSDDGDTSYVFNTTNTWTYDSYSIQNAAGSSGTINWVRVYIKVRATVLPNQTSARTRLRIGGVNYNGTATTITTSYAEYFTQYANNPTTNTAWTWTNINDLQAGVGLRRPHNTGESRCTRVCVVVSYTP